MSSPHSTPSPALKPRIGFALSTMERTQFTEKILPGLDCGGFDLIWCDGSKTPEGKAFASPRHFKNTPLVEVCYDVRGGPDAAIQFSLKRLLARGYDYVGLIENDIQLKPGWLEAMMAVWQAAEKDGFKVGAVSAYSVVSRTLACAQNYGVLWNMGAAMALFSRAGAEAVLADYHVTSAKKIHEFYLSRLGINLADAWELFMDKPDRGLGADWHYAPSMLKKGLAAIAAVPGHAEVVDLDLETVCRTQYLRSASQPLLAHSMAPEKLLAVINWNHPADPVSLGKPKVAGDFSKGKDLTSVQDNSEFELFLRNVIRQTRPRFVIETGTYLGQGTTRMLASALKDNGLDDARFFSIECNPEHHRQALANLTASGLLPFVKPLHGLSVPRALLPKTDAIKSETIDNVSNAVFVDHSEEKRVQLYFNETNFPNVTDDLLGRCLRECDGRPDLLLLDSAGHMGHLEFNYVLKSLRGPCYIALDDVYHVKHARSMEQIKTDPRFEILNVTREKFGSLLARFTPVAADLPKDEPARILFVRTDSIGDAVLASSMLEPIRQKYPLAKLAVLCQQHVADLFLACPLVDSIICYERRKMELPAERTQILKEITAYNPDVILNSVRSRDRFSNELTQMFPAARHVAIEGDLNNISPADHNQSLAGYEQLVPTPGAHKLELARHADFLRGLGIESGTLQPVVWTAPADEQLADAFFRQKGLSLANTIAVFPGAQHGVRVYHGYGEALKELKGFHFLIFGDASQEPLALALERDLPGRTTSLCGRANLRQTTALLRRCQLYVGAESAGAHMACAVGVPSVVVLGGGHFGRFLPYSPLTSAVSLPLECFGCNWRCPHSRPHCIKDVAAIVLAQAIRQTLEKTSSRPRLFLQSENSWPAGTTLPAWKRRDELLVGGDVEIIEVAGSLLVKAPVIEAKKANCPVCEIAAPVAVIKKDQIYHHCPACGCVFTAHIDSKVMVTENSGHGARHDQNQDAWRLSRLLAALGRHPEKLVDFGCGQGETTRFFQSKGFNAVGIDKDTEIQLGDVSDESVDGILMVEVIEHLYQPHAIFEQFKRILKPGGVIYVESSFADNKDLMEWAYLDPAIGHCTVHSLRSMAFIAAKNGFELNWTNSNVCCFTKRAALVAKTETVAPVEIVGEGIADPIVSVVISTYKSEKFIRACLENLSRQTIFDRCEIIVVDSGSPENERAIVAEFQQKFPNIRYVRTPRETLYAAWNRGLALARGRYWANANTDDALRDDALELLAAALDQHTDCGHAYADTIWTARPNDTFPSCHVIRTVKYPRYAPIYTLFYCITACLQFYRTRCLRSIGGFDPSLKAAGDYEATLKMMTAGFNAAHVPEALSLFYQNTAGLTQGGNNAMQEHNQVTDQCRSKLDINKIFHVPPNDPGAAANAWTMLGSFAFRFCVPWEDRLFEQQDFTINCLVKALDLDPQNKAAGVFLASISRKNGRLDSDEPALVRRWPKIRAAINLVRQGQEPVLSHVPQKVIGPEYRPFELQRRPTKEQLSHEPASLRPWICRIDGRNVYLSEDLFPPPAGLRYANEELRAYGKRLRALFSELSPFYAHVGGAGDALLLLASFYDQKPDAVVISHPNNVGAAKSLFDAFPKLSKIYYLPQQAEPVFHAMLRYTVYELKNCLGAGTTPQYGYDEWKASLDIEKKYHINKSPLWISGFKKNVGSRRIALAPKGSLTGMVGSKRNTIRRELWPQIIAHIQGRGFEPVILGVPGETGEFPALPGCVDLRHESFPGQMRCIGECAGLVGADSWGKTFSALAKIPTIVFEPIKGPDLANWKDPAEWVFIEPWPAIKLVRSLDEFRSAFDAHIARIPSAALPDVSKAAITWEGSFLDYGSLSHINRELTSRLKSSLNLTCVGPNTLSAAAKDDSALRDCAKKLSAKAPANTAVTVRHQWPPNWSKPASGSLVVIQPWEYGSLPKAWVEASANVDEFWVPSPLVRTMYLQSGIAPEKVRVVPNGVDIRKFHPGVSPRALTTKKKFKFLFVGGTIFRKGPDILLDAYTQAFTAADDVCLVIKDFGGNSFYNGQTAEAAIRAFQQKSGAPEILYVKDEISSEQMPSLYMACDCLVLPYRGEGFGMPVLEAMSCGLPVIVTEGGATDSFVTSEAGWKIPSVRVALSDRVGEISLVKPGWILQPGKQQLTDILRTVASRPDECRRRGTNGRAIAERRFDWNDIAAEVAFRLKELAQRATVSQPRPVVTAPAAIKKSSPATMKVPEVALIGNLNEARGLFKLKNLPAAWEATFAAIARRPYHPEACLLLAEIALAAGDSANAKLCAQRARDLAPGWPPAKQFLKGTFKSGAKPEWLKLPDVIRNSKALALSVCLIARNEEKFLARCLNSIRPIARQIIVVDTGSTDATVSIAKESGAEVYSFPWCDDFSAARNAALEHATGDWVLILDADEELPAGQHPNLLADMKKTDVIADRLPLVNHGQEASGRNFVPRFFRNAPGIYFYGRIHEQIFPSILPFCKLWGLRTAMGTAEILHHGYTRETMQDRNKVERNLKLLRQANDENPGDVILTMNLGLELVRSGNLPDGVAKYREAFELMSKLPAREITPETREVLLTQFTSQLYKVHAHQEILQVLDSPLAKNGGLTPSLNFALGLAQFALGNHGEAAAQIRQCLAKRRQPALSPINTDILTSMPNHCLALALAKTNDLAGAEKAFLAALAENGRTDDVKLDYAKFLVATNRSLDALHKLRELISTNGGNAMVWRLGAEIALGRPEFLAFARDWTGEAMRYVAEDSIVVAQRAEALMLNGDTAAAIELWERLWNADRQPRSLAALILCQAIESPTTHAPDGEPEEALASRAFIAWYQRLITMRCKTVLSRLNEQMDKLSRALPTAAHRIEKALAEAQPPKAMA